MKLIEFSKMYPRVITMFGLLLGEQDRELLFKETESIRELIRNSNATLRKEIQKDVYEASTGGGSSIQLSADAIKYFNRIAEVEKDRNAIVISRPWLIIGLIASMIFGCSILGAAFYILISHLIY